MRVLWEISTPGTLPWGEPCQEPPLKIGGSSAYANMSKCTAKPDPYGRPTPNHSFRGKLSWRYQCSLQRLRQPHSSGCSLPRIDRRWENYSLRGLCQNASTERSHSTIIHVPAYQDSLQNMLSYG